MNNDKNAVYDWLANYFETTSSKISDMLKEESAISYLLIWPIFEQALFEGKANVKRIKDVVAKYDGHYTELTGFDEYADHFYRRYTGNDGKTKYEHLIYEEQNDYPEVRNILKKDYLEITNEEKLKLLVFVAYRYRNNIFHGNKGIESWSYYKEQINYCLNIMMTMLDCARAHEGELV